MQLGGEPNFDPKGPGHSQPCQYVSSHDLEEMLREDLIAEYHRHRDLLRVIRYIGEKMPRRRLLEGILEQEEEHADELRDF